MGKTTIVFGVLLTLLGAGAYLSTGRASVTALIPAFFGLPLILCGALAAKEKLRMHIMHVAVLIGLLGTLGSFGMAVPKLIKGNLERPVAVYVQLGMGVICLVFVILCVKSFVDVRKARQAGSSEA